MRAQQNGAANDQSHKRFSPVAGADFDVNYAPINSPYPTAAAGSYIVRAGDTLTSIAQALWGDSSLWYLLADANGLAPSQPLIEHTVLTVPGKVTNIHNNAGTFKPYEAGSAMGNTSPTVPNAPPPPQPKGGDGCGGFVKVLAIVVAVVVTIYTAGTASGFLGSAIAGGALGGAAGAVAGQAVMIAGGQQKGMDWKGVALGALGGAVAGGIGASSLGQSLKEATTSLTTFGQGAINGAVGNVVTNGVGSLLNISHFDWKGVAISAVSAGVGAVAGRWIGQAQYGDQWDSTSAQTLRADVLNGAVRGAGAGLAAGAVSAAMRGNLSGNTMRQVGLDVLGSTIGNGIIDASMARNTTLPMVGASAERNTLRPIDVSYPLDKIALDDMKLVVNDLPQTIELARPMPTMQRERIGGSTISTTADPAQAATLPTVVVTPDGRTGEYAMALNEYAYRYGLPAPAVGSSMSDLQSYRHAMYAQTAPAYQQWMVNSTSHVTPNLTDEERGQLALRKIYSDPTGASQREFEKAQAFQFLGIAGAPALMGATAAVGAAAMPVAAAYFGSNAVAAGMVWAGVGGVTSGTEQGVEMLAYRATDGAVGQRDFSVEKLNIGIVMGGLLGPAAEIAGPYLAKGASWLLNRAANGAEQAVPVGHLYTDAGLAGTSKIAQFGDTDFVGPLIPDSVLANRAAVQKLGIPTKLSSRQELHLPPVTDGRSVLTQDPSSLLKGLRNGEFDILRQPKPGQIVVDFGRPIGEYWSIRQGTPIYMGRTNYGAVAYGKNGAHIYPLNPVQR